MMRVQHLASCATASLRQFKHDKKGIAAVEFGLLMPFFFGALVYASLIGSALLDKQDVAKKVRLGVEGLIRYQGDVAKAKAFAENTGQSAFSGTTANSVNDTGVTISVEYRCRTGTNVTKFTVKADATCTRPETWYTVSATDTSISPFGQQTTIGESVTFLGD